MSSSPAGVEYDDFAERVVAALTAGPGHVASGRGGFFNILDLYEQLDGRQTFPRGFPYSARIGYTPWDFHAGADGPVAFNLGLWSGILDVNAVDKRGLASHAVEQPNLRVSGALVLPGALACMCSMNMQFRRSLIPVVYQLPMHIELMPGWVIDRYGDIWGRFVLKTPMDLRRDRLSVGEPIIHHLETGSLHHNIWQEHLAHLVNDEFVSCIRAIGERLVAASYLEMMSQLHEELAATAPTTSPILRAYLRRLDGALGAWVAALRQA